MRLNNSSRFKVQRMILRHIKKSENFSLFMFKFNLSDNNQDGVYFESLEEFHVFVLAHIIQRPIIIVSDTVLHDSNGEPLAPIPFGGIYLPLECDVKKCYSYPILLTYDSAHFSALVLMDDGSSPIKQNDVPFPIIPITYSNMDLLTIHFSYDPGKNFDWPKYQTNFLNKLSRADNMYILQDYLSLVKIDSIDESTVSITNINVDKPTNYETYHTESTIKPKKKSKNTKLQKFLNIFKRDSQSQSKLNDKYNMQKAPTKALSSLATNHKQQKKNCTYVPHTNSSNTICSFKSWDCLFDSLGFDRTILAAELNLNKPPKYDKIVQNYINSAKEKYLHLLQLEKMKTRNPIGPSITNQYANSIPNPVSQAQTRPKCAFYNCNQQVDYRYSKTLCQNCAINVYHDDMQ
jgi:OTU domain-containing protein 7